MGRIIRTYLELSRLCTFEERFNYLKLSGCVGTETFGFDRIFNQKFYNSAEWKHTKTFVIARDLGCDLGIEGYELEHGILVHHINPISLDDIENRTDILLDPSFLITTSLQTHNAIHYGAEAPIKPKIIERCQHDTCLWRH